jgi:hypothetical protein
MDNDYKGNPYHVSGNAILHALAHEDRIDYQEQREIQVSHGVFCPSVYGVFPSWHSQNSGRMSFPSTLKPIEQYADLFLFRRPSHPWIHDGRPRDAVNTPAMRSNREHTYMAPRQKVQVSDGKPRKSQWYIHAYLTASEGSDILPLEESRLDDIQVGGKRNYGFGQLSVKDTMLTDLDTLDYSRIENADNHVLELMTPYVLESEYPHTPDRDVPGWWDQSLTYRTRGDIVVEQRERHDLKVVDHGQVAKYYGRRPVETAKNGVTRIGSHSKYGFGELWVRPADGGGDKT